MTAKARDPKGAGIPKEHLSGSASPTERTMAWLREQGYTVDKVEQKVRRNVTRDFMGFADVLAIKDGFPITAVQATSGQHLQERAAKVFAEDRAALWLKCGYRLYVVGWSLAGEAGTRKTYKARMVEFRWQGGGVVYLGPAAVVE